MKKMIFIPSVLIVSFFCFSVAVSPALAGTITDDSIDNATNTPMRYAWHTFYGSSGDNEGGQSIAVDNSGNTYITGSSNATWNGPAGQAPLHAHSGGRTDAFVMKLNSSGAYQWHTFYGDGSGWVGGSQGTGVALDDSGNVYITGQSNGSWAGPSGEAPLHPYDGYGSDILVLKLDTNGAYQWHTYHGGGSNETGYGIAVGGGNVYVTGVGNLWKPAKRRQYGSPFGRSPQGSRKGGSEGGAPLSQRLRHHPL